MSFEPPAGILDIGNATLRVGKLEVAETSGLNQGLQNIIKNDLLITENTEYASSNTWGIKLPTTWVAEFDVKGHSTTKYVEFNFYNEDKTSNTSGYTLNFKDTSLTLKYDNGTTLASATIPTIVNTYRKVNIFFERNVIAVSIDGTRYLYDKRPSVLSRVISTTGSAFVNLFIEQNAANSKFKNLRIVNGRFISDKTSNIAFMGGNLGVGVNSPQEALDIRGNMHLTRVSNVSQIKVESNVVAEYTGPHDRPLRKYPEVALTIASESGSGENGYKVSWSSIYGNGNDAGERPFNAFNGDIGNGGVAWMVGSGVYGADGTYAYNPPRNLGTATGGNSTTVNGEYIILQTPNRIKVKHFRISDRSTNTDRAAEAGKLYGSNDGSTWYELASFSELTYYDGDYFNTVHVNATTYYDRLALVVTNSTATSSSTFMGIGELEYYGHEEGSGSLDTTLKTVYNVPATTGTQLEVYYDAKDLADGNAPTNPVDLSPNTNNATLGGDPQVSNGAFVFDGSGDAVISGATSFSGSPTLSYSVWFKTNSILSGTGSNSIVMIGHAASTKSLGFRIKGTGDTNPGNYRFYVFGGATNESVETGIAAVLGRWTHATIVRDGLNMKLYIDGKFADENTNTTTTLNLDSSAKVALGNYIDSSGTVTTISANDSYDGSIANFRLYSKALNADQIKELYDYQKDYFLGSKSQVTLYKGHLGVGVTEPSGQLELAGDERIQEYPPRGLTGYETLVEGHGVFCASASSIYTNSTTTYLPHFAFNKTQSDTPNWNQNTWNGGDNVYSDSTGLYTGSEEIGGIKGDWIKLKFPYQIKLQGYEIKNRGAWYKHVPDNWAILGSNDDNNWEAVDSVTSTASGTSLRTSRIAESSGETVQSRRLVVNSTKYYKYLALVTTKLRLGPSPADVDNVNFAELIFFGTPGPTTLDKGSLTLGRSLDVPRVSRYDVDTETPRPEKLVVDFDTTVNRFPIDISGNFNDGTLSAASGAPTHSIPEKAFNFDGVNGVIYSGVLSPAMTGDRVCSMSAWFKTTNASTVNQNIMWLGHYQSSRLLTVAVSNGVLRISIGGTCNMEVAGVIESNTWYHVVGIKAGTGAITSSNFSSTFKLYLNGKQVTGTFGGETRTLNVTTNYWYIGAGGASGQEPFSGYISNPKLYDTILEPSEVQKLYRLGRTGRSMVISDTAVGIGKAPEAQLDVRGVTRFDGRVGIGTNVPNFALHIHGNNKGVTAITGAQWINWLTNPNYNGTYNGDSPSYPVTTHASMTNTGVYSRHSIGCSGYLWSHGSTLNMSDRRVKTNIVDANDDTCLRTLRQLKPKQYNYINIRERGSDPVWGFIAQEVKEAIPYSTTLKTDYIPNIDEKARLLDDGRTIVFTNFNTASLESNATTIRIMNKNQEEIDITLTDVLDPNTIRVKENITEHTFVYDQEDDNGNMLEGNYVYVYGQEIDDFVYLKKDAIWTVTTAALQEVDRQLQYERARNDALEARVTVLEQAKYM
jgi:hypothetical protein